MSVINLNKHGIADFNTVSYNSRRIESVELASGDSFLFFVDQSVDNGQLVYDITKQVNGSSTKAFSSLITGSIPKGCRILSGCRKVGDALSGAGIKWIGYKGTNATPPYQMTPFIETYSASVSYNKNLNQIDLYFWTNLAVVDGTTPVYSIDSVAVQQEPNVFYYDRSGGEKNVYKVLCHSRGMFIKGSVNGTMMNADDSKYVSKESTDYIPIFDTPKILHVYKNQDSVISDFSSPLKENIPFDIRRLYKPDSGTVEEKYAIYLPRGFWRNRDTKVLRTEVAGVLSEVDTGSDWFYLSNLAWKSTSVIPASPDFSTKNDFRNLNVTHECEIWTWLSNKGVTIPDDKKWYDTFSSSVNGESESGTSYVTFNVGTHEAVDSPSEAVLTATQKGLCIHLATLYKTSDGQVFIHQLYHGLKQDLSGAGPETKYLPYDLKIITELDPPSTYLGVYLPVTGVWMRNSELIGSVPSTGWAPIALPASTGDIWAVLRENTTPPSGVWYEHINSAKLEFVTTASDVLPETSDILYGQCMRVGRVTVVTGETTTYNISQYYHGVIKDTWKSSFLPDNEDTSVSRGEGDDISSDSIERYTVHVESSVTDFLRISGMNETADPSNPLNEHTITWPVADATPSDLSLLVRDTHAVGYLQLKTTIQYLSSDGMKKVFVAAGDEIEVNPHTPKRILSTTEGSEGRGALVYGDVKIASGTSSTDDNTVSEVTGFHIDATGDIVLETVTKTITGIDPETWPLETVDALDFDGFEFGRQYYGFEGTKLAFEPQRILSTDDLSQVSYLSPEIATHETEGKSASFIKKFSIQGGKLLLETDTVDIPEIPEDEDENEDKGGSGGAPGQDGTEVDFKKRENDSPNWGINTWESQGNKLRVYLSPIVEKPNIGSVSKERILLPFDLTYEDDAVKMAMPIWRRYGVDIPLKLTAGQSIEKGFVNLGNSLDKDIWAVLKKDSGPSSLVAKSFVASAEPISFDEWYGDYDTNPVYGLITYDGIEFANDTLHPESYHMEYLTALNLLRGLQFYCENLQPVIDELTLNAEELEYLGTPEMLQRVRSFLSSVFNDFNDYIYDLTDADSEENYRIYKFIPLQSNPTENAFIYSHIFAKDEEIFLTAGGTITAKNFLKLLIDKCRDLDGLYDKTETEIISGISTIIESLLPISKDVQASIVSKIDTNFELLKQEVYDQHLYLLSGSDSHYEVGAWKPENLVEMNGSGFTFDYISTFRTEIEDYINNPSEEKETSINGKIEFLLQNDFNVESDRSLNSYAQYSVPMCLSYYNQFYPNESLTSLFEPRIVSSILMGDPDDFTVNSEKEYVIALLNKLAYCYTWPGHFYAKREAILSVVRALEESKNKVLALMTDIWTNKPTGTYSSTAGAGGGTKRVVGDDENGTWVLSTNSYMVYYQAMEGTYLESPAIALIAKARASDRNKIMKDSAEMRKMNGPVKPSKTGPLGSKQEDLDLKDVWVDGRIDQEKAATSLTSGRSKNCPVDLSEQQKQALIESITKSIWESGQSEDEIRRNTRDRNKNLPPDQVDALVTEALEKLPKEALQAMTSKGGLPTINFVNIGYSLSNFGGRSAGWSLTPNNPIYHTTKQTFSVYIINLKTEDPSTEQYTLQGIYVEGHNLMESGTMTEPVGVPVDLGVSGVKTIYTFTWTVPTRNAIGYWNQKSSFEFEARFKGTKHALPVNFKTSPLHFYGPKTRLQFFTETKPNTQGINMLSIPAIYSNPGEILVKKYESETYEPSYYFKEWKIGDNVYTPTFRNGYLVFNLNTDNTVTAVYEQKKCNITYVVEPDGWGTATGPLQISANESFSISAVPVEHYAYPNRKYAFKNWICTTPNAFPFSGESNTSTTANATCGNVSTDITLKAVFEETLNYDPPTGSATYRVVPSTEGGGGYAFAVVDNAETALNETCTISTDTSASNYYTFDKWICNDADGVFGDVNAATTTFTSSVSKTFAIQAKWVSNSKKRIQITARNVKPSMGTIAVTFVTDFGTDARTLTAPDYTTDFVFDPSTMTGISIAWTLPSTVKIAKEDVRDWEYGITFNPASDINHSVWLSEDVETKLGTRIGYLTRIDSGSYTTESLSLATVPKEVILYTGATAQTALLDAQAEFYDSNPVVRNGETGYWKYTFDQWTSITPSTVVYPLDDYHSGYFGSAGTYASNLNQATVTIPKATFDTFKSVSALLSYVAYYTKTFVPKDETPSGSTSSTVQVSYDSTIVTVTTPPPPPTWLDSGDLRTAVVNNGTSIQLEANIAVQSLTNPNQYVWDKYSYWTADGVKISSSQVLTYTVFKDVELTPHPTLNTWYPVYIRKGPTDANITLTVSGPAGVLSPDSSIAPVAGYVAYKINKGAAITINHTASNPSYVFDGIYDVEASIPVSGSITISRRWMLEVRYKKTTQSIPVSYSISAYNQETSQTETFTGRNCVYGAILGPDTTPAYSTSFSLRMLLNSTTTNTISFVEYAVQETYNDNSVHLTTLTSQETNVTINTSTKSVEIEASITVQNSEPPSAYEDHSISVRTEPRGKGSISISISPLDGNPVSGEVNYDGTPFVVKHETVISLSQTPTDTNYVFKYWTVLPGAAITDSNCSVTALSDTGITAVYELKTDSPGGGGGGPPPKDPEDPDNPDNPEDEDSDNEGTPTEEFIVKVVPYPESAASTWEPKVATKVKKGNKITISVTPNQGYVFRSWGDGDVTGAGSESRVSRVYTPTASVEITAYFELLNKFIAPGTTEAKDDLGSVYTDSVLPWYAPRDTTQMEIIATTPSGSEFQNIAALHIGKVTKTENGGIATYNISQYYHGERVDYIDYGDADCEWSGDKYFKSIIFNDGQGKDSNRKPARLYGFDSTETVEIPTRTSSETDTDWKKYGLLARKQNSENALDSGAELVYLKIPETPKEINGDSGISELKSKSISKSETTENGQEKNYVALYNFVTGNDGNVLNPDSSDWTGDKNKEKLLVRKETTDGFTLQYMGHNPVPAGNSTKTTLKWDDNKSGWTSAELFEEEDKLEEILAQGDRVVTVIEKSDKDGKAIKFSTKPLGAIGGGNKARPWEITITKTEGVSIASFSDPYFQHGAVVKAATGIGSVTLTQPFIGASVNPDTGDASIIQSTSMSGISETSTDNITDTVKIPLFQLNAEMTDYVVDFRSMPGTGTYW